MPQENAKKLACLKTLPCSFERRMWEHLLHLSSPISMPNTTESESNVNKVFKKRVEIRSFSIEDHQFY